MHDSKQKQKTINFFIDKMKVNSCHIPISLDENEKTKIKKRFSSIQYDNFLENFAKLRK